MKRVLISLTALLFISTGFAARMQQRDQTAELIKQINPAAMWSTLSTLTSQFPDRSSMHLTGVAASSWIRDSVIKMAQDAGRQDIQIYTVDTKGFDFKHNNAPFSSDQPSVVLKIGKSNAAGIVVGAHFDTMACNVEGCAGEAGYPGADDDGSGTTVLLELARVLLNSNLTFDKPVYLIWYAAEERGCWGSQAVVTDFVNKHIPVDIIMQLDQMGYAMNNESTLFLESDDFLKPGQHAHIDHAATYEFKSLAEQYTGREVKLSCTGNSDNESWVDIAHVRAVRPLESDYCINGSHNNPNVHTPADTMDTISLTHMTDYAKLALVFVGKYGIYS